MNWYALFVRTGEEERVGEFIDKINNTTNLLDEIEFSLLLLKRKVYERKGGVRREVIRDIYPGYILVNTNNIAKFANVIKFVPDAYRILHDNRQYHQIYHSEIDGILDMTDDKGVIDISDAMILDSKVIVVKGPLVGKEGKIKKIDKRKGRVKVEFNMFGNIRVIELGINLLQRFN